MNFVLEGLSDLWQTSMANREMRREKVTAFARHCWTWIRTALILKAKPWLVQFVWPRTRKVGIEVIKWMETHLDLRADPTGRRGSLTITMASFTEKLALLPSAVVSSLPSASPSPESILEFSSTSGQIAGWLLTGFIMVLFEFVISRIRRQRLDNTMATKHAGFKLSSIFSRRKGGGQSTSSNKTKGRIRNFVPRGLSLSSSLSSTSSSSEKKRIEAVG
ncbi:hypothetical protein QBC44DRAFT_321559 [Cladorrhinum sp. PSN332]|nr:hypothetical protein QBC44DRAFT_321559 [Cladorrhinum sp. PSN332]